MSSVFPEPASSEDYFSDTANNCSDTAGIFSDTAGQRLGFTLVRDNMAMLLDRRPTFAACEVDGDLDC